MLKAGYKPVIYFGAKDKEIKGYFQKLADASGTGQKPYIFKKGNTICCLVVSPAVSCKNTSGENENIISITRIYIPENKFNF